MPPQRSDRAYWFVISFLVLFTFGGFAFLQYEIHGLSVTQEAAKTNLVFPLLPTPSVLPADCGASCQSYIDKAIDNRIKTPTSSGTPSESKTQIVYTQLPQNPKVTYLPVSGGSTRSTDWVDIGASAFSLDMSDYGNKASAYWDANLRVDNANGTTFVRLFDKTHGIAVNGSEISVSDTSQSTDVFSPALGFWSGNNSYVVQIKSLNSSTAYMDFGRIKIVY